MELSAGNCTHAQRLLNRAFQASKNPLLSPCSWCCLLTAWYYVYVRPSSPAGRGGGTCMQVRAIAACMNCMQLTAIACKLECNCQQ